MIQPAFYRYRLRLFLGILALLTVDGLQLVVPRLLKSGIDDLAAGRASQERLFQLGLWIIAIAVLATLLRFCWRYLIIGFSRFLERDLRRDIVHHVMAMDGAFHARNSTGSIMALCSNDLSAVQMACGMGVVAMVDAFVMSAAAIVCMLLIHPGVTLLALLPMPLLALATRFLSGKLHHRFSRVQEQFSAMTEFVRSSIRSIRLLKSCTIEDFQTRQFASQGREYVRSSLRVAMIQGLLQPIAALAGGISMLLLLYFGGQLVILGAISMGDFVALSTYLAMLVWPITAIGWVANLLQRGITSLQRMERVLAQQSQLPAGREGLRPSSATWQLCDLHFSYPGAQSQALSSISLAIPKGILGVTGPTGSGKTTLCQVLARMYPVPMGSVFVGTEDVNHLSQEAVQSMVSYVSQEPLLFSGTIAENISFAEPGAGPDRIMALAKTVGLHEEIMALPEGYASRIGERGVKLSGGQRQRVALARALLCARPLLIIDDGLSAVDAVTEQAVLQAILPLLRHKTVVLVSQRIKQLALADQVLVLEQGRISALGSFAELEQGNPFLSEICRRQRMASGEWTGAVHA